VRIGELAATSHTTPKTLRFYARITAPFARKGSRAVVTMCTDVAQWYRPGGPLPSDQLARDCCMIARMAVDCGTLEFAP